MFVLEFSSIKKSYLLVEKLLINVGIKTLLFTIDPLELYNSMPKRFFDPRIGKAAHAKVHKKYLVFIIQVLR